MKPDVMRVEEAFKVDLVEVYNKSEEEANRLWEKHQDYIFQGLWDEYSHLVNQINFDDEEGKKYE